MKGTRESQSEQGERKVISDRGKGCWQGVRVRGGGDGRDQERVAVTGVFKVTLPS